MQADFCVETLNEAGLRISMGGRGGYLDNIFTERLWRSLKQKAIYLEEVTDDFQARRIIKDWMTFYNIKRPHSALDRQTPHDAYWAGLEKQRAAGSLNRIYLRKAANLSEKVGPFHKISSLGYCTPLKEIMDQPST